MKPSILRVPSYFFSFSASLEGGKIGLPPYTLYHFGHISKSRSKIDICVKIRFFALYAGDSRSTQLNLSPLLSAFFLDFFTHSP